MVSALEEHGEVDNKLLFNLQQSAQKTAINLKFNGKNWHEFKTQLQFAFQCYENKTQSFYPDYAMPDALKCDFAIENFNREILAWITLLSQKEKRYSTDWTLLETEITKKYDDPNRIYPPPQQEAKKPAPRSAKVQFTVPPDGLTYHPNRFQDPAPPLGPQQAPFAADRYLQNCQPSRRYPNYFPTTLAGPLGDAKIEGTPGHMLRMFLGTNGLCNLCRCPGHMSDTCPLNRYNKGPQQHSGN